MKKKLVIWISALVLGIVIGIFAQGWVTGLINTVAHIFTRLFQFIAVPTISLAIITTLASIGGQASAGRMFRRTLTYTVSTTVAAALVALILYTIIAPDNIAVTDTGTVTKESSYLDYFIGIFPDNIVRPYLEGNVMSILLISAAFGLAMAFLPETEGKKTIGNFFTGLQEIFFKLIGWLIEILPVGIAAYAAQLVSLSDGGTIAGSLGQYALVILGGNIIQMTLILPMFLLIKKINPLKVARAMASALTVAFFTKSSAGTLPVSISCAIDNLKCKEKTARFVFPICATINMNGCAAFILTTSLFVMQNAGMPLSIWTMLLWVVIAVVSAIGNAGVPMGCFFMTMSLMSGIGAPIAVLGMILPLYTVIDMVETAENVWSDCCVCAAVNKDIP